jgi:hypothetical protein
MLNNIWKKKLKTDETLLAKSDAVDNSLKPKSQRYNSIIPDEVEKNLYSKTSDFSGAKKKSNPDLDIFAALPKKKEKLEVKSDIKLEESKFNTLFIRLLFNRNNPIDEKGLEFIGDSLNHISE